MWQYLRWKEWLQKAMSDGKSGFPSTKRLGYMSGILVASVVSLVMLGIIVGLSLNIPLGQYQFVFATLNDTILWIIGLLLAGSSAAYITTKKTENNTNDRTE